MQKNDSNASNPSSWNVPWYTKTAPHMMNKQGFLAGLSGTTAAGPTAAAATMQSNPTVTFWKKIQHNYTKFDKLVNNNNY